MVGEPTVYTQPYFDAFRAVCREVVDAMPVLIEARAIKTAQEIERMRLANELAAIGMEYAREHMKPGEHKESEVAAMIEGHIHAAGIGYKGKVEMARAFTLVWSGKGIATFTATSDNPIQEHEPTLVEIWVCADGYWNDLTKNLCPGRLTPEYNQLLDLLLGVFNDAVGLRARRRQPAGTRSPHPRRHRRRRISRAAVASGRARRRRARPRAALCAPGRHRHDAPGHGARHRARNSTGRAAAACAWKTISWSPKTAAKNCAATRTISASSPRAPRPEQDHDSTRR